VSEICQEVTSKNLLVLWCYGGTFINMATNLQVQRRQKNFWPSALL